jgi:Lon protease-like protein
MTTKLPLFPLNTVLYPFGPISLHIFEERYRTMIARCLEQSSSFGVVLIRSGQETDPNDPFLRQLHEQAGMTEAHQQPTSTVPFGIGTSVRLTECHRLEDGRYYISAIGQRRFRVQYIAQQEPYLVASVTFLPEHITPELVPLSEVVRDLYARYWQAITSVTSQQYEVDALPEDPLELSYALAQRLQVELARKQRWLEADVALRLRELAIALRSELALIPGKRSDRGGSWAEN